MKEEIAFFNSLQNTSCYKIYILINHICEILIKTLTFFLNTHNLHYLASNPNYFTPREALCGEVHLRYTILRFISTNKDLPLSNSNEDLNTDSTGNYIDINDAHSLNLNEENKGQLESDQIDKVNYNLYVSNIKHVSINEPEFLLRKFIYV